MATAQIRYTWQDGDVLDCRVRVSESYPDAVAEAKAQALTMYATALGLTVSTLGDDERSETGAETGVDD